MKRWIFISIFILFCKTIAAQQTSNDAVRIIIELVEELAASGDDEDSDIDFEQLYEQFINLYSNPINLNTATRADLEQLYILTDFQISSILDYIKTNGQMLSVHELAFIHGFDNALAESLYPFLTISTQFTSKYDTVKLKNMLKFGSHQVFVRAKQQLEKQAGYKDDATTKFEGSPLSLYARYTYKYRDKLKWNITTEKDAGEKFFDFYSAHVQYDSKKFLRRLVVGDFQAQFGQGLVLWNGFSFGKSTIGTAVRKRARGVYGYSSTDENRFFRGVAANMEFKKVNFSIFASYKNRDASIADSVYKIFTSLQTTGLHRTQREIDNKQSVGEMAMGGNVNYEYRSLTIGATALWHKFGNDYVREIKPYNIFELNKNTNYNYSVDLKWAWRRVILFAESAFDANNKSANLLGATFSLEQNVQLSLLYRNYSREYQSLYASGFGDGSRTANEKGFFAAIACTPIKHAKVSGYIDVFSFPWLKYRVNAPSSGYSYALNVDYSLMQKIDININVKQKSNKENYTPEGAKLPQTLDKSNFHLRCGAKYSLFGKLNMQTRAEYVRHKLGENPTEKGFVVFQDIAYDFKKIPVSINLRYAYINTDSWNTRVYAYESDVLYASSIPAYYSKSSRWYFNVRWAISKRVDFWLRAAQTIYRDKDYTGSGLTKIDSNKLTEIKTQIRVKL